MENSEITVVFKYDLVCKNEEEEITFEANKKCSVNEKFFESLSIKDLDKLIPESFWQNIKFVPQAKIEQMNKIKQSEGYSFQRYNNNLVDCVTVLLEKHVDAAFEYLKAKRRSTEKKNIYFTQKEIEQFKEPLIVGKESLQLLYPEQKDYFDKLKDDELQKEIDKKLMLNIEYDKELKRGNVLRDKGQSHQIDKIKKVKEEELYNELLKINEQYINYFDLDFLYRKIIEEKSNDGQLNDFQKAFVFICNGYENIIYRVQFGFRNFEYEEWFSRGWEFYKFLLEHTAKSVIQKFQLGQYKQISWRKISDLTEALECASLYLETVPRDVMYKIIFHNGEHNTIDLTIKKIADLLSSPYFILYWRSDGESLSKESFIFFRKLYYLIIDEEKERKDKNRKFTAR